MHALHRNYHYSLCFVENFVLCKKFIPTLVSQGYKRNVSIWFIKRSSFLTHTHKNFHNIQIDYLFSKLRIVIKVDVSV